MTRRSYGTIKKKTRKLTKGSHFKKWSVVWPSNGGGRGGAVRAPLQDSPFFQVPRLPIAPINFCSKIQRLNILISRFKPPRAMIENKETKRVLNIPQ
jgi:hypothetical protein